MSLRQFNATYVAQEDRVLFRMTTNAGEEYRLWLSRARVIEFLNLGEKVATLKLVKDHDDLLPQQAQAVAEFNQQTAKENANFTQFEPAVRLPLGAEPLLVQSVQMTIQDQVLVLQLEMSAGRVLTLRLTDGMVSQLRVLLENISEKAGWHIGFNVTQATTSEVEPALPESGASGSSQSGPFLH